MGENTKIEWATHTWNAWTGCSKVSPACTHCYAESWAKRSGLVVWGDGGTRKRTSPANWREPHKWNARAKAAGIRERVFVNSLSDWAERREELDEIRRDMFRLIRACEWLDFLLLTKRADNIPNCLPDDWGAGYPNVWLGVTAENQHFANERIRELVRIPAVIRFVSAEPLLESFDIQYAAEEKPCAGKYDGKFPIDWLIVGGESGAKARISHPLFFQRMRWQCQQLGIAFFFKQHGEYIARQQLILSGRSPGDLSDKIYANAVGIGGDTAYKVGKDIAGDLLDGVRYHEMPV